MYRLPVLVILIAGFIVSPVFAKGEKRLFVDSATYTLTDNDSKNDARRYCFLEAGDKVVAKVKSYLNEALERDRYNGVDKEDVDMYTEYLLKIDTKEEKWQWGEKEISVTITAVTDANDEYLIKRIFAIKEDDELREKMLAEQAEQQKKEQEYTALQNQLTEADTDSAMPLRKQRQALSLQMDKLEDVTYLISDKTKTAANKIQPGMTLDEVLNIAGQPRATATCDKPDFLNYGSVWVCVSNGVVTGKIPLDAWSGPCGQMMEPGKNISSAGSENDTDGDIPEEEAKYVITLKNGQEIRTSVYYTVEDVIYYKKYDGIIGVGEDKIEEIRELE